MKEKKKKKTKRLVNFSLNLLLDKLAPLERGILIKNRNVNNREESIGTKELYTASNYIPPHLFLLRV